MNENQGKIQTKLNFFRDLKLSCQIIQAKNLSGTDMFGKSNPYVCVFVMGGVRKHFSKPQDSSKSENKSYKKIHHTKMERT
jgi:hypothetical protein